MDRFQSVSLRYFVSVSATLHEGREGAADTVAAAPVMIATANSRTRRRPHGRRGSMPKGYPVKPSPAPHPNVLAPAGAFVGRAAGALRPGSGGGLGGWDRLRGRRRRWRWFGRGLGGGRRGRGMACPR